LNLITAEEPRPFRLSPAQGTLLLLIALNLLNFIDRYILPGEVTLIQHEFHATDQQMGALTTALFVVYLLVAPLTGWLADIFPRKPLIVLGAVCWSLATLATVWVHDYQTLYLRHALVGVGEATFTFLAPTVLADFYPARERNRILSIFYAAIPIGAAMGYLAGGMIGSHWGWRTPFLVCGAPGILVAALYGFWGSEPERGACDAVRSVRAPRPKNLGEYLHATALLLRSFIHLFTNPAYMTATFGLAMLTFAMGGISAWVPTFLSRVGGLSVGNASMAVSAITVVDGIGGTLVGGWIAQRWLRTNHRALYLLSFWSVALTLPCGVLLFFGPHAWAVPSLSLAEFFLFLNTGPLNTAIVNSVGAPVRATAIGLNLFFIHAFGDTFSPQIIGAISDRTNLSMGLGATLITLLFSCALLFLGARFAPPMEDAGDRAVQS
jgi:MFS family permease